MLWGIPKDSIKRTLFPLGNLTKNQVRQIARENNFKIIFEFHPQHNWNPKLPIKASTAEEIIQAADPFFNDGAIKMMIDSDQFDALGNQSDYEINKLIKEYSLEKLVFEVESPKKGRESIANWIRSSKQK